MATVSRRMRQSFRAVPPAGSINLAALKADLEVISAAAVDLVAAVNTLNERLVIAEGKRLVVNEDGNITVQSEG